MLSCIAPHIRQYFLPLQPLETPPAYFFSAGVGCHCLHRQPWYRPSRSPYRRFPTLSSLVQVVSFFHHQPQHHHAPAPSISQPSHHICISCRSTTMGWEDKGYGITKIYPNHALNLKMHMWKLTSKWCKYMQSVFVIFRLVQYFTAPSTFDLGIKSAFLKQFCEKILKDSDLFSVQISTINADKGLYPTQLRLHLCLGMPWITLQVSSPGFGTVPQSDECLQLGLTLRGSWIWMDSGYQLDWNNCYTHDWEAPCSWQSHHLGYSNDKRSLSAGHLFWYHLFHQRTNTGGFYNLTYCTVTKSLKFQQIYVVRPTPACHAS